MGRVLRPHGTRGAVVVELTSNRPGRLDPGSSLVVQGDRAELRVSSSVVRPRRGRRSPWAYHNVAFEGVTSRRDAEPLRGAVLLAPAEVDPEVLWIHEVVGARVLDRGEPLGRVVAVEANPASDLMVLGDGQLVPMRFVVAWGPGRIEVELPPGLLEV